MSVVIVLLASCSDFVPTVSCGTVSEPSGNRIPGQLLVVVLQLRLMPSLPTVQSLRKLPSWRLYKLKLNSFRSWFAASKLSGPETDWVSDSSLRWCRSSGPARARTGLWSAFRHANDRGDSRAPETLPPLSLALNCRSWPGV